jgi:hypothetical protein
MTDLTPMFYFLAVISMEAFLVVTAIVLVLISLLIMTTKFVKILR